MTPRVHRSFLIRTLCAIYEYCGKTTHCHVAPENIAKLFPRHLRGQVYDALHQLVREGLVYEKPHGKGRKSYGLTREGVELALTYCVE